MEPCLLSMDSNMLPDKPRNAHHALPRSNDDACLDGVHILLVEDNRVNQLVLMEMLVAEGAKVELANDGREAIEKATTGHYDLVLMDLQMPCMGGVEATLHLRRHSKLDQVPIVALTGNIDPSAQKECEAAGMNGFLPKPISPSQLYAALRYFLGQRRKGAGGRNDTADRHLESDR